MLQEETLRKEKSKLVDNMGSESISIDKEDYRIESESESNAVTMIKGMEQLNLVFPSFNLSRETLYQSINFS